MEKRVRIYGVSFCLCVWAILVAAPILSANPTTRTLSTHRQGSSVAQQTDLSPPATAGEGKIEDPFNALGRLAAFLGFGGLTGFLMGYAAKKILKLLALIVGTFLLALQALAFAEWVTVHWERIANAVWPFVTAQAFSDQLMSFLTAQLPYLGGFAVGFMLGFKRG